MKKTLTFITILNFTLFSFLTSFAGNKKVQFQVLLPDGNLAWNAIISVNGQVIGKGELKLVVPGWESLTVKVEMIGYITGYIEFNNKPGYAAIPNVFNYVLLVDDAYNESGEMLYLNRDYEIKSNKTEIESWKLIFQTVLSYFDEISVSEEKVGYIKTDWANQNFKVGTVRTRVIVKLVSNSPLTYNIKISSETLNRSRYIAGNNSEFDRISIQNKDDIFVEWSRLLNKYKDFLSDLESKLESNK